MTVSIRFENVSKAFRLTKQKPFLARDLFRRVFGRRPTERHIALSDVSFELEQGDSLGVIGTNGAGKSTLLSLIAKTSYPTAGQVTAVGRVGPLLELGAGFHPDLTGYENIFLNASLLGFTRQQVEQDLQSIIDYSELRDFIDAPLQTYSTGMIARLGFAVIAHMDPDILLADEILAVGDVGFQQKCERTMEQFRASGKTFVLVSHVMGTVQRLCRKVLWIEEGRVRAFGPVEQVSEAYLAASHGRDG